MSILRDLALAVALTFCACRLGAGCSQTAVPQAASTVTVDTTVCALQHYSDSADQVSQECAPLTNAEALQILDAANAMAVRKAAGVKSVSP
jgi:hypothetical protein